LQSCIPGLLNEVPVAASTGYYPAFADSGFPELLDCFILSFDFLKQLLTAQPIFSVHFTIVFPQLL
jgi:hypothetical protein